VTTTSTTSTNTGTTAAKDAPLPILEPQSTAGGGGESIVFGRDNTKGVFRKRVVSRDIITTPR
jgi:hypothetical protein